MNRERTGEKTRKRTRTRARHPVGGLRTRLVATFVAVALISAVTATALAYREARTAVLQRTQNTAVNDVRARVGAVAVDFDLPPDQRSLDRFAARVSEGIGGRIVAVRYRDLSATSDPYADTASRIGAGLRAAVRAGDDAVFQRVRWRD
ncbi:two-component sensor histidine kinase, partial [Streptomyces sp. NPDC001274]